MKSGSRRVLGVRTQNPLASGAPERTLVSCAPGRLGTGTTGTTGEEAWAEAGARRVAWPYPRPAHVGGRVAGLGLGGPRRARLGRSRGPGECGGSAPLRAPRQPRSRPIAADRGARGPRGPAPWPGPRSPGAAPRRPERPARPPALQPAPRRPAWWSSPCWHCLCSSTSC